MQEEKFKKIVIASTVAAVILFVFLIIFLVGQLISISAQKKRDKELQQLIEQYNQLINSQENDISIYEDRVWLEIAARELGMKFPDDIDWDEIFGSN